MNNYNTGLKIFLALALLLSTFSAHSLKADSKPLDTTSKTGEQHVIADSPPWLPLYDLVDKDFQTSLETLVASKPKWKKLIDQKRMALGVVDLSSSKPRFARINGNSMMYAASLPKIAVLFAVYSSFEDGTVKETPEIHRDLAAMIRVSNNRSAAKMVELVGLDKIATVLTDPKYGFYDEARGGGLWVGKSFSKSGKRKGDPLHNISHGATVTQIARFYYLLSQHKLINPERSEQMLNDLKDPHLHHKFVSQLDKLAPNAIIYRKSGTWKNWHSDSVLVRGTQWRNYILVAMVEDKDGATIIANILPAVEKILQQGGQ